MQEIGLMQFLLDLPGLLSREVHALYKRCQSLLARQTHLGLIGWKLKLVDVIGRLLGARFQLQEVVSTETGRVRVYR